MDLTIDGSTFAREIGQPQPDLLKAALLFARDLAYPDLRPSTYLARLDGWTETLRHRLSSGMSEAEKASTVARYLFKEVGLQGNAQAYYDPRNSYLNEVMDRRLGIPISLSAVFLSVGWSLGLHAEGVALPGHFVVAVRQGPDRFFFDPFAGGEALSMGALPELLERRTGYRGPLTPVWLAPASIQAILARMLHNLRSIYLRSREWSLAALTIEHLAILQPDVNTHIRDLGLALARAGRNLSGAHCLQRYLLAEPDADDAGQIRTLMNTLYADSARMN